MADVDGVQAAVAEYQPLTFPRVSCHPRDSHRRASLVYTASWDGRPVRRVSWEPGRARCTRPSVGDAESSRSPERARSRCSSDRRPSNVRSVSDAGAYPDAWGSPSGPARPEWWSRLDRRNRYPRRDPRSRRRSSLDREFPLGKRSMKPGGWSLRVVTQEIAWRFRGPAAVWQPAASEDDSDRQVRPHVIVTHDWSGYGLAWAPSGTEIWFTATRPGPCLRRTCGPSRSRARCERCIARRLACAPRHLQRRQGPAVSKHHSHRSRVSDSLVISANATSPGRWPQPSEDSHPTVGQCSSRMSCSQHLR